MPGIANRFRWDRSAAYELIRFGRFIFVSTLAGFFVNQGDKIVLGKLVSFADLGIYNIGFFMASFPLMLGAAVAERVLFPLYRQVRPSESPESRTKIRRARSLLTGSLIVLLGILAVISNLLIGLLYDPRYAAAGPILIVLVLMQLPVALTIGNSQLLLAEGNSRDFSKLVLLQAVLNFIYMLAGFWLFGIFGVLLVQGLITLTIYPLQQYYLRRHHGTDLQRDAQFALIGLAFAVLAIWWNWEVLSQFFITSRAAAPFLTGSWHPATVFGG